MLHLSWTWGCGQGTFADLFAENGLRTHDVDLSEVGISAAREVNKNKNKNLSFAVGDILDLDNRNQFDCVFTRSCSLYNSQTFEEDQRTTEVLDSYVREGGVLIFVYHTRIGSRGVSPDWILHSVANVRNHFRPYPGAEVYFSLRLEAALFGRLSFTRVNSAICERTSRLARIGEEVVAFVRKSDQRSPETGI